MTLYMNKVYCAQKIIYYTASLLTANYSLTSLPKVIWEEGRKVTIGYSGAPQIRPKSSPSHGTIPKRHYQPHLWSRPTYDA